MGREESIVRARTLAFAVLLTLAGLWSAQAPARADDAGAHIPSAEDRYSLANGCFALRSIHNDRYVTKAGDGYNVVLEDLSAAEPIRMQATDLGKYLLYDAGREFVARSLLGVNSANAPSDDSDWTVVEESGAFRITLGPRDLALSAANALTTIPAGTTGSARLFEFELKSGCVDYPEVEVNVNGPLPAKGDPNEPVRGLVETHMHQMAYEFLGTKAHCGRPWHRFGAPTALTDCPDHAATGGCGAILETALSGTTCHDPGGWPSFGGWPRHNQYTHEQSYYKWLERSWRGGLKIFVNLLVENRMLCELYPLTPLNHSCNEMDTVRREAVRMHELERYIDAQNGGPGKGWYRIVESPQEARQVIADGKLAVIMGMEVSEPFGCILNAITETSQCTAEELDAGIDEVYDLGVRQLEIINKFDNGLSGVAGDSGTAGVITNAGNFLSTLSFWDYEHCDEPLNHDHSPTGLTHNDDVLISNGLEALGLTGITLPVYGPPPHCNQRGLSDLGERAIRRIMDKGMIFDPDHMSVIGRNQALDVVESEDYPGVMTSHSWSTDNALPRISALGGFIGPAAKSPQGFIDEWNHIKTHGYDQANPYLFGVGYGADMNGFASQGGPPAQPISYPFTSPVDPAVTLDRQVSGQKTFDYNELGTAHYGLYPDWTEAVRIAGGPEITNDLVNGAEAYLQMWERTIGASGPGPGGEDDTKGDGAGACRKWPSRFGKAGLGKRVRLGEDRAAILARAGEPSRRGARSWRWCVRGKRGKTERVTAVFSSAGRVSLIVRSGTGKAGKAKSGTKLAALRRTADPAGNGVWVRPAGRNTFFYVVRGQRVKLVGVVAGDPTPGQLRKQLRLRKR